MNSARVFRICVALVLIATAFYFMYRRDKREEARAEIEKVQAELDERRFQLEKDDREGTLNIGNE